MTNEDFCSYEIAVRLKELGFDWECYEFWDTKFCVDGTPTKIRHVHGDHKFRVCVMSERNSILEQMGSEYITAPTLAKAQKWLRKRGLCVSVYPSPFSEDIDGEYAYKVYQFMDYEGGNDPCAEYADSYEAALSAGIEATLKLIE